MTKKQLFKWFSIASMVYLAAIALGVYLRIYDTTTNSVMYSTYKDMIPFIIAIPATWLGYCLQRRSSYLQQLRNLVEHISQSSPKGKSVYLY